MNELIKFNIPAYFVSEKAILTPAELRYGFEYSWLSPADTVELALRNVQPDTSSILAVNKIALLLSDELDKIPAIMDSINEPASHVWFYLTLGWIREHMADFDDPFEAIEMLYADFGYPDEIAPMVRFMPAPDGLPGMAGIEQRWEAYIDHAREHYLTARARPYPPDQP